MDALGKSVPRAVLQENVWLFGFKYSAKDLKLRVLKYTLFTKLDAKKE